MKIIGWRDTVTGKRHYTEGYYLRLLADLEKASRDMSSSLDLMLVTLRSFAKRGDGNA